MIVTGYLIWTLIEYFGHRYLFHWEFPGAFGRRIHFLIHGVHHDHPNDPLRLVMPILLSGPIMIIAFFVATLLFGATLRLPALVGFVSGYLAYDMVHFLHASRGADDQARPDAAPPPPDAPLPRSR